MVPGSKDIYDVAFYNERPKELSKNYNERPKELSSKNYVACIIRATIVINLPTLMLGLPSPLQSVTNQYKFYREMFHILYD